VVRCGGVRLQAAQLVGCESSETQTTRAAYLRGEDQGARCFQLVVQDRLDEVLS
jgi:hypothetical protein